MRHARYQSEKLSNLKLVMLIAHSSNNLALQKTRNESMLSIDVNNVLMVNANEQYSHNTSVARILPWGGCENDVTFGDTLYTEAHPERFSVGDTILN